MNKQQIALATSLVLSGASAQAIELRDVDVYSALDEPLRAEIVVLGATSHEITAALSTSSLFSNGADQFAATTVEVAHNADNKPVVVLTGMVPFTEPFLHFSLTVESNDESHTREYTVLLDPPGTTYQPRAKLMAKSMLATGKVPEPPLQQLQKFAPQLSEDGGVEINLVNNGGVKVDLSSEFEAYLSRQPQTIKNVEQDPALQPEPFPIPGQTSVVVPIPADIQQ